MIFKPLHFQFATKPLDHFFISEQKITKEAIVQEIRKYLISDTISMYIDPLYIGLLPSYMTLKLCKCIQGVHAFPSKNEFLIEPPVTRT